MNCYNMNSVICSLQIMIVYYMLSRTNKKKDAMIHNLAINNLAIIAEDIWNKVDFCPFTQKYISKLLKQEVWRPYLYLQCEKHLPGGKTTRHK